MRSSPRPTTIKWLPLIHNLKTALVMTDHILHSNWRIWKAYLCKWRLIVGCTFSEPFFFFFSLTELHHCHDTNIDDSQQFLFLLLCPCPILYLTLMVKNYAFYFYNMHTINYLLLSVKVNSNDMCLLCIFIRFWCKLTGRRGRTVVRMMLVIMTSSGTRLTGGS